METHLAAAYTSRFRGPTSSQTLALDAEGSFLASVNPDSNSVTLFEVRADRNRRIAVIPVQIEPNGVAMMPDASKMYVANTVSGTVTVIKMNLANGVIEKPTLHIPAGVEPYGVALTPNGSKLYVTASRSNSVYVIDTYTDAVETVISNVGFEPRGIAITNDGDDDDTDETVYVTQFLSLAVEGKVDGQDDAKNGKVTVISATSNSVTGIIDLLPIADTGFKAAGDAIGRIAPTDPPEFTFTTGAYVNQLNNVAIKGNKAYIPNVGASPNGPVRFNVNTQSLLSVADMASNTDAGQTINMHQAVGAQGPTVPRLFITVPWAIAFEHSSAAGFVVAASSDIAVKVTLDAAGKPAVATEPGDPTRVLQIPTGKNPRGIVVNGTDTRAYIMNYISRDVTVLDLTPEKEAVLTTMQSSALPAFGSFEDKVLVGKELYNTSVGVFDAPTPFSLPIRGRMSAAGWGSCASCHPNGLSDNVVWIFPAGPRRTIPQNGDFDQTDITRSHMRVLNWSANREEQEDFELNIRGVSGGQGLIVQADGVTPDATVVDLTPTASAGRNQLKVRGFPAWDAIKAYIQVGVRTPISPVSADDPDVVEGRALFTAANCQSCHGGAQWTTSRVDFTPPPAVADVVAGQVIAQLRPVGTFDPALLNEIRQNAAPPLGDAGFVPPSLLGLHAYPQTFLHGGAAKSLGEVMDNVTHRTSGTGGVDTLANPADREKLVKFLQSIDASTTPIAP